MRLPNKKELMLSLSLIGLSPLISGCGQRSGNYDAEPSESPKEVSGTVISNDFYERNPRNYIDDETNILVRGDDNKNRLYIAISGEACRFHTTYIESTRVILPTEQYTVDGELIKVREIR